MVSLIRFHHEENCNLTAADGGAKIDSLANPRTKLCHKDFVGSLWENLMLPENQYGQFKVACLPHRKSVENLPVTVSRKQNLENMFISNTPHRITG